jgi:3-phenylpropionate/trans-cinnamate dioxygenase ferredoxin reductase subunit
MIQRDYLIIGAGIAAGCAVESLRSIDKKGSVTVVGNEAVPPYVRPQLIASFLGKKVLGVEKALHQPAAWYEKQKVELRLDMVVTQLNTERRVAVLSTGQAISFNKAILAMGSRPKRPLVAGANLGHVLYVRSWRDVLALREIAETEKEVVVIGGGLIAMEVVAALRGLGRNVTLMSRYPQLWQNRLDGETSAWLTDHFRAHGVNLLMQETLNGFEGKTVLKNIQTKSGQRFPAGLAVVAIGAEPNVDLVANTPLSSPNGTPVNEYLETDDKGIFAAGDIALYPDKIFGGVRRLEHYEAAREQGRVAGLNITGKKRVKFEFVPRYSTQLFDLKFDLVGDISRPPSRCEIVEGDRFKKKFVAHYFQGNYLMGKLLCNQDAKKVEAAVDHLKSKHG